MLLSNVIIVIECNCMKIVKSWRQEPVATGCETQLVQRPTWSKKVHDQPALTRFNVDSMATLLALTRARQNESMSSRVWIVLLSMFISKASNYEAPVGKKELWMEYWHSAAIFVQHVVKFQVNSIIFVLPLNRTVQHLTNHAPSRSRLGKVPRIHPGNTGSNLFNMRWPDARTRAGILSRGSLLFCRGWGKPTRGRWNGSRQYEHEWSKSGCDFTYTITCDYESTSYMSCNEITSMQVQVITCISISISLSLYLYLYLYLYLSIYLYIYLNYMQLMIHNNEYVIVCNCSLNIRCKVM